MKENTISENFTLHTPKEIFNVKNNPYNWKRFVESENKVYVKPTADHPGISIYRNQHTGSAWRVEASKTVNGQRLRSRFYVSQSVLESPTNLAGIINRIKNDFNSKSSTEYTFKAEGKEIIKSDDPVSLVNQIKETASKVLNLFNSKRLVENPLYKDRRAISGLIHYYSEFLRAKTPGVHRPTLFHELFTFLYNKLNEKTGFNVRSHPQYQKGLTGLDIIEQAGKMQDLFNVAIEEFVIKDSFPLSR